MGSIPGRVVPKTLNYGTNGYLAWCSSLYGKHWLLLSQKYSITNIACLANKKYNKTKINKRTNGPVNAHLRSGLYTNKHDLAIMPSFVEIGPVVTEKILEGVLP